MSREKVLVKRKIHPNVEIEIIKDELGQIRTFIKDDAQLGSNVILLPSYWKALKEAEEKYLDPWKGLDVRLPTSEESGQRYSKNLNGYPPKGYGLEPQPLVLSPEEGELTDLEEEEEEMEEEEEGEEGE